MYYCHISPQFSTFSIYSMVTYYPILFIIWLRNTLFFIKHCIVRELFKVFVVFLNKFDFTNWQLFWSCYHLLLVYPSPVLGGCSCILYGPPVTNPYIETKEAMYVQRDIYARSCNNCCGLKAICITYTDYVSAALVIEHALRMRHIVIYGMLRYTIFFNVIS
jgi:hypothetical protein